MSSGGAPCGACKFLRRKCVSGCIFAPYFDSDQGAAHFAAVHKIFGASNVSKLLQHIPVPKRGEAVVTICYEAQARLKDPVYGCIAHIFSLQQQVMNLQAELAFVQAQLTNRLAGTTSMAATPPHSHAHESSLLTAYNAPAPSYDHRAAHQVGAAGQLSMSCHPGSSSSSGASSSLPYCERLKEEGGVAVFPAMAAYNHVAISQLIEPGGHIMMQEVFQRNRNNNNSNNPLDISDEGGELQALAHELLRRNTVASHGSRPLSDSP